MANKWCGQLPQFDLNKCAIWMNGGSRIAYITLWWCACILKRCIQNGPTVYPLQEIVYFPFGTVSFSISVYSLYRVAPELINGIQEMQFRCSVAQWLSCWVEQCIFFQWMKRCCGKISRWFYFHVCFYIFIFIFRKCRKGILRERYLIRDNYGLKNFADTEWDTMHAYGRIPSSPVPFCKFFCSTRISCRERTKHSSRFN